MSASSSPIVLIVMENHEYPAIVGSSSEPYLNQTLIPKGRLFTNYHAISHPSLPNYLAMTSGSTDGKQGTDSITAGEINVANLFHQLSSAGISWAAFEESMPEACYKPYSGGTSPNKYVLKHDPAMAYENIASSSFCKKVVPLGPRVPSPLPAFSFVTPNECNDMHSCPERKGDTWLHEHVPQFLSAGATVIVTFDEGSTNIGGGGHVMTLEVGAGVKPGTRSGRAYDHYSLLAGIEGSFGLPRLQNAGTATPLPL